MAANVLTCTPFVARPRSLAGAGTHSVARDVATQDIPRIPGAMGDKQTRMAEYCTGTERSLR
ncbi:hypothetical protein NN4_37370 [Nocardia ninae NBRC 108245]|uniref:Uncharacterized protein n=1 Tax=Nocardia ninae NBRC 108245 TaxID=1210091 RepID=A0A511MGM3_9NOCA|nr:hypothetical protein NN4_37370 [Nocardia ninae NBRC 108245]